MKKTYKRFMINTIMNTTTDDVYLAVLQEKPEYFISHLSEVASCGYMTEESYINYKIIEKQISDLGITNQNEIKEIIASCGTANHFVILVKIGDKLWDMYNQRFIDLNIFKVVRYNKLSDIYEKDEYKPIICKPQDNPVDHELTAGIDLAYWEPYFQYLQSIEYPDYEIDLTEEFIKDIDLSGTTR